MRARIPRYAALLTLLALLAACQSSPPPAQRQPVGPGARARGFDAQQAWAHLEALAAIGPRVSGTQGNARARAYIQGELQKLGLELVEQQVTVRYAEDEPPVELRNVAAILPGDSTDVFLLAAPYDSRYYASFSFLGVNDGASGAAVLLELARVLSTLRLHYTVVIVFLDGEAPRGQGDEPTARRSYWGSMGVAQKLQQEDVADSVRLAVVINQVCDPDLRVARDSLSHRNYREWFWQSARRLGHTEVFPRNAPFESVTAGQGPFRAAGIRVVAIVDTSFGGDEPPGIHAGTEDDDLEHCAPESLGVVGKVTLEALGDIAGRLARIDHFADAPLEATQALSLEHLDDVEEPTEADDPAQQEDTTAAASEPPAGEAEAAGAEVPPEEAEAAGPETPPEEAEAVESTADAPEEGTGPQEDETPAPDEPQAARAAPQGTVPPPSGAP